MSSAKQARKQKLSENGITPLSAWRKFKGHNIFPVFLPYLGCPGRCVFCSQHIQTGINLKAAPLELDKLLESSKVELYEYCKGGEKPEIAFYGGTFTSVPDWAWHKCLKWIEAIRDEGLAADFRCSTRPDAVSEKRLEDLKGAGCNLVELGVQTFNEKALLESGRKYGPDTVLGSVELLKSWNLDFGIQLLPGMPGAGIEVFLNDVKTAIDLEPACLRYYPCLVLGDTELEKMWKTGNFAPWPLEQTIITLGYAWLLAQKSGVPVIRMGLAPQAGLESKIKAGPRHAALGSRIMGYALLLAFREMAENVDFAKTRLFLPKFTQGYLWGWHGEYGESLRRLGIVKENINYWDQEMIAGQYL